MFDRIEMAPADPILGLEEAFKREPNPAKINLAAGVYRDSDGNTPVLRVVKRAEQEILRDETNKELPRHSRGTRVRGSCARFVIRPKTPIVTIAGQ